MRRHPAVFGLARERTCDPMKFQMVVGDWVKHELRATYLPVLRLLIVRIDGRAMYYDWRLLGLGAKRPREFRSGAPEVHFYLVDPPGWRDPISGAVMPTYRLWLDGSPVAMLGADGPSTDFPRGSVARSGAPPRAAPTLGQNGSRVRANHL
jgi:hypothetical protein